MIQLTLDQDRRKELQVLCLGAHSDDIEIGCGGTILRLGEEYPNCKFHWVVFNALGIRETEARHGVSLFVKPAAQGFVSMKAFRDGYMLFTGAEVKDTFEELKEVIRPDVILTHNGSDAHQDHRFISQLTWNTFRNHFILEYEIPKFDGDLGRPSVFFPFTAKLADKKADQIMDAFKSQQSKQWFQRSTFLSLMRLRGMECNADSGYAEAFYCRKLAL